MRSVHSTNKNEMRAINRQICNLVDKYGTKLTGITSCTKHLFLFVDNPHPQLV